MRIAAVIEIDRVEIVVGEHAADAVGLPGSDRRNGVCIGAPRRRIVGLGGEVWVARLKGRFIPALLIGPPCPPQAAPSLMLCSRRQCTRQICLDQSRSPTYSDFWTAVRPRPLVELRLT